MAQPGPHRSTASVDGIVRQRARSVGYERQLRHTIALRVILPKSFDHRAPGSLIGRDPQPGYEERTRGSPIIAVDVEPRQVGTDLELARVNGEAAREPSERGGRVADHKRIDA